MDKQELTKLRKQYQHLAKYGTVEKCSNCQGSGNRYYNPWHFGDYDRCDHCKGSGILIGGKSIGEIESMATEEAENG